MASDKDLKKAAKELNKLLKPDTPIQMDDPLIEDKLKEAGGLLEPMDAITDTTANILIGLDVEMPSGITISETVVELPDDSVGKVDKKSKSVEKREKIQKGPSNKFLVYQEWEKNKSDPKELHSFIQEKVKLNTIRNWVGGWKKGIYLPAGISIIK